MAFRRNGHLTYEFYARMPDGGQKQFSTGSKDGGMADKVEAMWKELSEEHGAWDVLERVTSKRMKAIALLALWMKSKRNVPTLRRLMDDVDIEPMVAQWAAQHALAGNTPDSTAHALVHVRALLPKGVPCLASTMTPTVLEQSLIDYKGKQNTKRKVHSSRSVFFEYCTGKGAFDRNPMAKVTRPKKKNRPIGFYELDVVKEIVQWHDDPARQAYYAMLYGTGADVSDLLGFFPDPGKPFVHLRRSGLDMEHWTVRALGTKATTRDRTSMIEEWARPFIEPYARMLTANAILFDWDRFSAGRWHRQATGKGKKNKHGVIVRPGLDLPEQYPAKCARHHYAVRMLRASTPVVQVAAALGHGSAKLTWDTYGPSVPSLADAARSAKAATAHDAERARDGLRLVVNE